MKDIRLLQLEKNQILVMTRPQGSIFVNGKRYEAGRGKIGYTILHSLNELTPEAILDATILTISSFRKNGVAAISYLC